MTSGRVGEWVCSEDFWREVPNENIDFSKSSILFICIHL